MNFGKRVSANSLNHAGSAPAAQQTCVRCCGTGFVRERGSKIICKPCKGSGRVAVPLEQASAIGASR
jgi:DnaJ-class molecular chaperone